MRRDPLEVRKAALASILAKAHPGIRFNEHIEGDGPTVFTHACNRLRFIRALVETDDGRSGWGFRPGYVRCGRVGLAERCHGWDLLMLPGGLSKKERGYIAYPVRRYFLRHKQDHPLLKYAHYSKVPVSDLLLLNLKFVIHELLELEAQEGPFPAGACRATARKLKGKPPPKRRRVVALKRSGKGK